jgi:hypothetical protein
MRRAFALTLLAVACNARQYTLWYDGYDCSLVNKADVLQAQFHSVAACSTACDADAAYCDGFLFDPYHPACWSRAAACSQQANVVQSKQGYRIYMSFAPDNNLTTLGTVSDASPALKPPNTTPSAGLVVGLVVGVVLFTCSIAFAAHHVRKN